MLSLRINPIGAETRSCYVPVIPFTININFTSNRKIEILEENRRKSIRVSCRLEVESKTFGQKWFFIYSKNIGMDGMMLTSESSIEKIKKLGIDIDKNIFLSFYLPNDENYVTKISGKVVYVGKKQTQLMVTKFLL
tara:strand:- start:4055 stop:4462 length:408 start_codon:yes stop_codon:yes gene_type:complete